MPAMTSTAEADLIIVGAGTCGLMAAIFAARRSNRLCLIEASAELGGSLLVGHGQISAAGTRLQAQRGITDTPQLHYEDVMRISKGTIDAELAHLAIFNAAATFDWIEACGYELRPESPSLGAVHEPYRVPRYYTGKEWGKSLAKVLVKSVREQIDRGRIDLRLTTKVVSLLQDARGAVEGVETEDAAGQRRQIRGRSVLLASGGYAANPALFAELNGVPLYARAAYTFNQGKGLELGIAAGGYVFGSILEDDRFPSPILARANTYPDSRPPWEIYVNSKGQRFVREDEPSVDVREHALLRQADLRFWIIFDQSIFERAPPIVYDWSREALQQAFNSRAMFRKAPTLAALASAIGLPPAALLRTVDEYNAGRLCGHDALGRRHLPASIDTGPFYAIRLQGSSVTSTVGLSVDPQLRVIRRDGTPIPNLYAAGEILGSGQLQGDAFVGGMMAMPALVFGRLLGESMIAL